MPAPRSDSYADRVGAVFLAIAARSGNAAILEFMHSLNDQLHAVRIREHSIIFDALSEIAEIEQASREFPGQLPEMLGAFHESRLSFVPALAHLLS